MVDPIEPEVQQLGRSPAISPSASPVMSPITSPLTWIDHINSLITLFRGVLIWIDVIIMTLAPFSRADVSIGLSVVTGAALIFNMFVCATQHWQRSHKLSSDVALHPILAILIDFGFFAGYVVIWVFEMLEPERSWTWNYNGTSTKVTWAYAMFGALIAW